MRLRRRRRILLRGGLDFWGEGGVGEGRILFYSGVCYLGLLDDLGGGSGLILVLICDGDGDGDEGSGEGGNGTGGE